MVGATKIDRPLRLQNDLVLAGSGNRGAAEANAQKAETSTVQKDPHVHVRSVRESIIGNQATAVLLASGRAWSDMQGA